MCHNDAGIQGANILVTNVPKTLQVQTHVLIGHTFAVVNLSDFKNI